MKLIKKEYVRILELIFKITYLLLGISTFNPFLYDSSVQPFLVKICLVLGMAALIGRLMFYKDYWRFPYWRVLALFCGVFLFSMIMNRKYGAFWEDFKWLIWTGLLFFLLYVCENVRDIKAYKKEFNILSHILILYSGFASAAGIVLLVTFYQGKWWSSNYELMQAGFHWGRLWGIYTDPNYGGIITVIAVLLCVYFIKKREKWRKIPYILIIGADYLYIVFCDSRTAETAMVLAVGFWLIYTGIQKKPGKTIILYVLAALIFAGGFIGGTSVIKSQSNKLISIWGQEIGRKEEIEKDVSNGRLSLWCSGIEIWKTNPIYGTGYNSFLFYTEEKLPDTYVVNNSQGDYISLHNEYLNILVYHGVLGAAVFLFFIILVLCRWCRSFWKISLEDRDYIGVLSACCIVTAVAMLFLLEGLHTNSPGTCILWTFLGYLMHYSCRNEKIMD